MFLKDFNLKFLPGTRIWISIVLMLTAPSFIQSQTRSEIIANQKKLVAEIELTQSNLKSLQKDKSINLKKWNALNHEIRSRNALLENLELERDMISADIISQEADIKLLKQKYDLNSDRFKIMLRKYYRTRTAYSPMAFILSSTNLQTAWKRMVFYRRLSHHYEMVEKDLSKRSKDLSERLVELTTSRDEKAESIKRFKNQRKQLDLTKAKQAEELKRLKANEKFLNNRLRAQEKQQKVLSSLLTKLVNESINKSRSSNDLPTVAKKLDNAFGSNKGKLPWPVEKGYVAKKFGKQRHPDLKMIFITNNGIDIVTERNAEVKSIFEGTVIAIQSVAGFQKTILVNHGTYYTVYANVENVNVSKGEKVARGQTLAYLGNQEEQAVLHFELWKVKTLQNPSTWLQPR